MEFTEPTSKPDRHLQTLFAKIVQEINNRMISGLSDEEILNFVFDALGLLVPYDRIGIALLDESGDSAELTWVRARSPIQFIRQHYFSKITTSSLKKIFETGQPRIINDLVQYGKEHPESTHTPLIVRDGIRSNLTCPLRAGGRPIGVVFFSSYKPNTYRTLHQEIFMSIADELSVIVEHARLHRHFNQAQDRSQTIRMMLHDLKTPLSVIQGFLDEISKFGWYQSISPEGKEIFSVLHRNTAYMLGLLNEISELVQLESDPHAIQIANVNLREFNSELSVYGRLLCEKKEMKFSSKMDSGLPAFFLFDPNQIRRVLDNLLTNAIKFSSRTTQILFHCSYQEGKLFYSIEDHGPGIPANEIGNLFHEFGRTSVRPLEGETSTGLGLAIAKKIVENHGGEISVSSRVGTGSIFTFWLPARD